MIVECCSGPNPMSQVHVLLFGSQHFLFVKYEMLKMTMVLMLEAEESYRQSGVEYRSSHCRV